MAGQTILSSNKSTSSRNASATLAFQKYATKKKDDEQERKKPIRVEVEEVNGKFHAKLHLTISGALKEGMILGPNRATRPEAILDAMEMGKGFVREGEAGLHRIEKSLERKRWTAEAMERSRVEEGKFGLFSLPHERRCQALGLQEGGVDQPLIPPGEGWTRHDEEMLVNTHSQVFFSQLGMRAGKYFKRDPQLREVDKPHVPQEHPISLRTASASWVRKGAKMDRAVLLNDVCKIARLALKFPLSFVDTPACAYALFQGHRSVESAQWCAENFHKKLLPLLAEKIHTYEATELETVLKKTLEALDAELLKSSHSFSGCSALVALVLGEQVVLAGVGQVRAVMIPEKGPLKPVLSCKGPLANKAERDRAQEAGGIIRDGLLYGLGEAADEASRIIAARNAFEVLQIGLDVWPAGLDEKQVRSAYRKLALRVHPDKQVEGADIGAFKSAFERLDPAKEALEAMLSADVESCREIHKVLCSDVHSRAGAAALLGIDKAAVVDTEQVAKEAEKVGKALIRKLDKMQQASPDYDRAISMYNEAVETIRVGCAPEALPRQEALLREGVSTSCAMGARDLRRPWPILRMEPQTASLLVPTSGGCRLALLCGETAALSDERLAEASGRLARQPKASALRWCLDVGGAEKCSSAVCLRLEYGGGDDPPPTKKMKSTSAGPEGTMRIRHILFRHQQLKQPDMMARRDGTAKTAQEAEGAALEALEKLIQEPNQFLRLCRELSDCQSGAQPGMLSGDLGWLAKGQQEQAFEDAAFCLKPNEFGDIVTTSRGIHIIQRLA